MFPLHPKRNENNERYRQKQKPAMMFLQKYGFSYNYRHLLPLSVLIFLQFSAYETDVAASDNFVNLQPPVPAREASLTKAKYRTIQVHIVHRHGDRTPITPLKDEEYWQSTLIPPEVLDKISDGTNLIRRETLAHKAYGRGPFGKLTQMGLLQMVELGNRLRDELSTIDRNNKVIEDEFDNLYYPCVWDSTRPLHPKNIKVLSTNFPRTIQSVQGVLVGLFPDGLDEPIEIDCRHTNWMIPDPHPRRTKEQEVLEAKLASRSFMKAREAELRPFAIRCTDSLRHLLGEGAFDMAYGPSGEESEDNDSTSSVTVQPLPWPQLAEITKCLLVRNLLPSSISREDQEALAAHSAWRWFESLKDPRLSYLSMHKMTQTIVASMQHYRSEPPVTIFSGHDSTLIGLICAFRLEQPRTWPEYGSYLKVELVEKEEGDKKEFLVRFYLNGKLLRSQWDGKSTEAIRLQELASHVVTEPPVHAS